MADIIVDLRAVDESTSLQSLETLLYCATEGVARARFSTSNYTSLLRTTAECVAPFLSNRALPPNSKACLCFDKLFLQGIDHIAFDILASTLRKDVPGTDVLARTATLFVSEQAGGVRRLSNVISHVAHQGHASDRLAASLIHLPTRIANAGFGSSSTDAVPILDESNHVRVLTRAVLAQPNASDPARDSLVSSLLRGLVRLGHANDIIHALYQDGCSEKQGANLCLLAPEQNIALLFRATLELPKHAGVFAYDVAASMMRTSATVRAAATQPNQFTAPRLQRPRVSLARLVRVIRNVLDEDEYGNAIQEAADVWGAKSYSVHAHVLNQQQLTRLVLLYFQDVPEEAKSRFAIRIAEGVSNRLDHGDKRIRRFGMVVGEAFSRLSNDRKPLKFPRDKEKLADKEGINGEDDGDSDFSELAEGVGTGLVERDDEDEERYESEVINMENMVPFFGQTMKKRLKDGRQPSKWEFEGAESAEREDWELEDDWTSIESDSDEELSDEETLTQRLDATRSDYEAIRKKIDAPMSIARLLGMLRTANSGTDESLKYDAVIVNSTLRSIASRARTSIQGDSFHCGAVDLSRAVVLVEGDRFPDEFIQIVESTRRDAIHALATLDIAAVGELLITDFAVGKQSDLKRRSEALEFLLNAAREVSERGTPLVVENESSSSSRSSQTTARVGTVTRRSERALSKQAAPNGATRKQNEFTQCASLLFFLLLNRLQSPADESILKPFAETDANFYSQSLAVLSALVTLAGEACLQRSEMARALTEVAARAATHHDASVRRAAALASGASASATTPADLADLWRATDRVVVSLNGPEQGASDGMLDWLARARDSDVDVLVRRFAAIALSKWTEKVQAVADGK